MVVFVVGLLPSQLWILRNQPPIGLLPFCSMSPANTIYMLGKTDISDGSSTAGWLAS